MRARTSAAAIAPSDPHSRIASSSFWKKLWMTCFQGTEKRPDLFMLVAEKCSRSGDSGSRGAKGGGDTSGFQAALSKSRAGAYAIALFVSPASKFAIEYLFSKAIRKLLKSERGDGRPWCLRHRTN